MSKLPTVNNKMEKAADLFLGKFSYSQFVGKIKQMTLENYWTNKEKLGKKEIEFNWKKASNDELLKFFAGIVPDFDRERVYPSHIKKIAGWYDLLVKYGENDFSEPQQEEEAKAAE